MIWGILFITWSCIIIIISIVPGDGLVKLGVNNSGFRWDYIEHFFVFFLLAILFLQWRKNDTRNKRIRLLLLIGGLLAISTELSQLFIQSRSFNYIDLLCNLAGLPIGFIIFRLLARLRSSST